MRKALFLAFFVTIFVLSGCSLKGEVQKSTNFSQLSIDITSSLLSSMKIEINKNEPLLVADFVNTKTLKNHSELGFILSNSLKNTLTKKTDFTVKEVELSNEIGFGSNGLTALTRDNTKISNTFNARFIVLGSYTITSTSLIVFTKIVDITTNDIIAASTINIDISTEILKMESKQKQIFTPVVI